MVDTVNQLYLNISVQKVIKNAERNLWQLLTKHTENLNTNGRAIILSNTFSGNSSNTLFGSGYRENIYTWKKTQLNGNSVTSNQHFKSRTGAPRFKLKQTINFYKTYFYILLILFCYILYNSIKKAKSVKKLKFG